MLCGPRGLPPETMSLYENDGKGVFADVSDAAGISVPKEYYGFTPLTTDFDNDGWTDIYVACDSTASLLYHNQKDGTFEEVGVISGTAYNLDGMEQAGMGVTAGDYDGDGDLDLFKTNFSSDTHTLYRNEGEMFFSDETIRTGLAVNTHIWGGERPSSMSITTAGRTSSLRTDTSIRVSTTLISPKPSSNKDFCTGIAGMGDSTMYQARQVRRSARRTPRAARPSVTSTTTGAWRSSSSICTRRRLC